MKKNGRLYYFVFGLIVLFTTSCVEKYFDYTIDNNKPLVVVEASINDKSEQQEIIISTTGSLEYPQFHPLIGCVVFVIDANGNEYSFKEDRYSPGHYRGIIEKERFYLGNKFKLFFTNYNGDGYESDYEDFLQCPPVDSVYYELKNGSESGVQFYIDIKANDTYAQHYRWKLEETYKFRSSWPINRRYTPRFGVLDHFDNYEKYYCYKTEPLFGVYAASTKQLNDNNYLKYPLNFVNNKSQRLSLKYSLLIEQYSLTTGAFEFWNKMQANFQESGGLTDKQPINVYGNIKSISNSDEKVLGYFSVSNVTHKRIFVQNIHGLTFNPNDLYCSSYFIDFEGFSKKMGRMEPDEFPYYLPPIPEGDLNPNGYYIADQECFDCTLKGGVLEEPDFWN